MNTKHSKTWKTMALTLMAFAAVSLSACGSAAATTTPGMTTAAGSTPGMTTAAGSTPSMTTAAGATTAAAAINQEIKAEAGKALLAKTPGAVLLDVRTVAENKELRIPGSTLIPLDELPNRLAELPKDPARPIVVYCRSGNRSATAAAILVKAGFPAVYDMGGIIDWPYETEKG